MFRNSLILAIFGLISFPIFAQPPGYSLCSLEHTVCSYPFYLMGDTSVAYGANGSFAFRNVFSSVDCDNTSFGVDPAPGIAKACYIPTDPPGFIYCGTEGANCVFSGNDWLTVAFGANGHFLAWPLPPNIPCTAANYYPPYDPAPGVVKNCFVSTPPPNYDLCSALGATCSFGFNDAEVAYGMDGDFVFRRFTNQTSTVCDPSAFFGVNLPGVQAEHCFKLDWSPLSYPPQPYGYTLCSAENSNCSFSGTLKVAYGANGNFIFRYSSHGISCTNAAFGVDPAPGTVKACYIPTVPPGFTQCSNENGACYFLGTGPAPVAYGANGNFVFKNLTSGSGCNNLVFGKDPAPGMAKACYIPAGPPSYTFCSSESGTCNLSGLIGTEIFYGWDGAFTTKSFSLGANVLCNNSTFGVDPAPGIVKACFAVPFTFQ